MIVVYQNIYTYRMQHLFITGSFSLPTITIILASIYIQYIPLKDKLEQLLMEKMFCLSLNDSLQKIRLIIHNPHTWSYMPSSLISNDPDIRIGPCPLADPLFYRDFFVFYELESWLSIGKMFLQALLQRTIAIAVKYEIMYKREQQL